MLGCGNHNLMVLDRCTSGVSMLFVFAHTGGCPDVKAKPETTLEQVADKTGWLPLPVLQKLVSWLNWQRGEEPSKSESSQESPTHSDRPWTPLCEVFKYRAIS